MLIVTKKKLLFLNFQISNLQITLDDQSISLYNIGIAQY